MTNIHIIYSATESGKQIIMDLVPQATEKKNFSYRSDDKNPSARLYPPREGRDYWVIKDFGAEGESLFSPIEIYMREKGIPKQDFNLAVQMLAEQYGVTEQLDNKVNRPRIEIRQATANDREGKPPFKLKDAISESEALIWGRNVKPEHLKELGWDSAERIDSCKGDKVTERYSTDGYPIFIQTNHYIDKVGNDRVFYKVYQPYSVEKEWRFYCIGPKPQDYIFGLDALQRRFNLNQQQPLERVAIVSGGSDAANCLAMGVQPVWTNSETQGISPETYQLLRRTAKDIYAILDCDCTGIEQARRLALQYLDVKVVWLDKDLLGSLHDKRGKQLKDLKDYLQIRPSQHNFENLLNQARPARFWDWTDDKKITTSLNRLCYFLWLNGYVVIRDSIFNDIRYVHIDGIVVEEVSLLDIQHFIRTWMSTQGLSDVIIDKVMRSRDVTTLLGSNMYEAKLDFASATPDSQWFYFKNYCVEVTKDTIKSYKYSDNAVSGHHVWKHKIIQHDYVPCEPMFTISREQNDRFCINIHSLESEVFCYLINASRSYWRKEMEYQFGDDLESKAEYARTHKFCISGDGLDEDEIHEQMQSLVNKIFVIGYLLHRYKMMSRAWAAICLDEHVGETDECNGRTGKSLFGKIIRAYLQTVTIEAKSRNTTERQFLYAKVTGETDFLFVDECHKNLDYDHFYARVTDDFQVERKGFDPEVIPFADSPKILIATNYINKNRDASSAARELQVTFSDYYHQRAGNNDYLENRSVADDFGHNLIDDRYQGWDKDIAFLVQCEQFYLSAVEGDKKILPPLENIQKRQQKALMGNTFGEWAADYYQPRGGHLDVAEKLNDVYSSYKQEVQSQAVGIVPFVKELELYCEYADHIAAYNPKDVTGGEKDGQRWRKHEASGQVRYIYVRSKEQEAQIAEAAKPKPEGVQGLLNFDPFAAACDLDDCEEDAPF